MMKKLIRKDDGFTLLEVMTSMVIMTFSLLLLLHMAVVALEGNSWASSTTSATQLLQDKLEELRFQPDPVSGADTIPVLSVNDTVGTLIREWTVTSVDSHLRQVDLVASWEGPDQRSHVNTINTFIKSDSL